MDKLLSASTVNYTVIAAEPIFQNISPSDSTVNLDFSDIKDPTIL